MYQNSRNFVIHPLPKRFGATAHILYETQLLSGVNMDADKSQVDRLVKRSQTSQVATTATAAATEAEATASQTHQEMHTHPQHRRRRSKRYIATSASNRKVPHVLFIETAIFVDRDLYRHMAKNYPKNTEGNLIRFVMAMINGVEVLYHHPSLGHQINFILKRLEILHTDPKELRRSSDIDIFLNSFCMWQRKFNPIADDNIFHFDHAVILTGKNDRIGRDLIWKCNYASMFLLFYGQGLICML